MLQIHPSVSPASIRRSPTSATRICHAIARLVAEEFELDAVAVIAPTRGAPRAAYARQVAMYLAHVGFAQSFEAIGRAFDRDRTTVSHACRVVEDRLPYEQTRRRLAALEAQGRCTRVEQGFIVPIGSLVRDDLMQAYVKSIASLHRMFAALAELGVLTEWEDELGESRS